MSVREYNERLPSSGSQSGNAIVLNSAMLGSRESSRVCCTMIGTVDSMIEAYEV